MVQQVFHQLSIERLAFATSAIVFNSDGYARSLSINKCDK